jgi:hypothetical protein
MTSEPTLTGSGIAKQEGQKFTTFTTIGEKQEVEYVSLDDGPTDAEEHGLPHEDDPDCDKIYSHCEQRKIIHKVDRRLVTTLGLLLAVGLMDRLNLANAAIAGMLQELQLEKGTRYSTIIIVFLFLISSSRCPPPS